MELAEGQIVTSRAGRDVTHVYMVLQTQGAQSVLLADGERRTLQAPKRKNVRHLSAWVQFVPLQERTDNRHIRAALKAFKNAGPQQGG